MKAFIKQDNSDDYEVTLDINGIEILAYIVCCPKMINVNNSYHVELSIENFSELMFKEIEDNSFGITYIGKPHYYSYIMKGKLLDTKTIDVGNGIKINTGSIFENSFYLIGKYLELKIDCLNVSFL